MGGVGTKLHGGIVKGLHGVVSQVMDDPYRIQVEATGQGSLTTCPSES